VTLAAEMRWGLLPPLTFTSPSVSVSGILQPSHLIAGDAFDYAVDHARASVAVFDAMGHGLEASQMANLAIGLYRNARRRGEDLADILLALDQVITSEFGEARFVTAQLASLDIGTGVLRIMSAGHPYPVHLRHGEDPSTIECPPCRPAGLGLVDPEEVTVELEPGDAVLFHSDGVSEARSPAGESLGERRMADMACALLDENLRPAEVLRRVMHHAIAFQGPKVRDDASMVLLRWCPEAVGEPEDPVARLEHGSS
jgi:serine phosphatase RsbU (regulator of sigma subunit)